LLEGKTITKLIVKKDKSSYLQSGVRKHHAGVIGFEVEGVGPIYLSNGAFGDSYGTFSLVVDSDGNIIPDPEVEGTDE